MYESSRRGFLAGAATSVAYAGKLKPSFPASSAARVVGSNDRINFGLIGVGIRGNGHNRRIAARKAEAGDLQTVAISDVYDRWKQRAMSVSGLPEKDICSDYRELLTRRDVDAVLISTPDHWHAQMAIDAMAAGKDVYLEKPMTLTIPEAKQVAEAAHKYGRVIQIGSGPVSHPKNELARKLIEDGKIGDLLWAQGSMGRFTNHGDWNYWVDPEASEGTVDWDRWLGSAPKRPFSAERYFRWRKYWDYSGGIATDLFYHTLGPILYAMGPQFPTRVTGAGGVRVHKNREVPDTYTTTIEYPDFHIVLGGTQSNDTVSKFLKGGVIYGSNGTMYFDGKNVVIESSHSRRRNESVPAPELFEAGPYDNWATHIDNFLDCMRTREQPNLNGDLGYQIMVAIKLGVDSYREGRVGLFDPERQEEIRSAPPRRGFEGQGKNYPEDFRRAPGD